ncbi:MAG: hypothetical protein ACK6DM_11335 [Alphaproteobacteria bacterium]|jgi:hypothetical protein
MMNRNLARIALVCAAAVALSACERAVARSCSTAQDAAVKVSALADDLNAAEADGRLTSYRLGEIGARIVDVGSRYGAKGNHESYCAAIDKIRVEAGLR